MVAEEKIKKEDFIKWLKTFLVDVEWTENMDKRVRHMLSKVDVVVTREVIVTRTVTKKVPIALPSFSSKPTIKPSLESIYELFNRDTGITIQEIRSKSRKQDIVKARMDLTYRMLNEYPYSFDEIGKFIKRDRSSVYHYVEQLAKKKEEEK
jgi:chromosomal replication initiation ATPase DnaA